VFHHVGFFVALQTRLDFDVSRDFSAGPLTIGRELSEARFHDSKPMI
jgi:hypothetical protein